MNIIEIFTKELGTDDHNTDKSSAYLKRYYNSVNDLQRSAINEIFICLCGWSYDTLLEMENNHVE